MRLFGLIGFPLTHSFSQNHFSEKFSKENINDCEYRLFSLNSITEFPPLLKANSTLCGLNVTIPYKESVIPFLDELDETAKETRAVNTIKWKMENGRWRMEGYNTDIYGFEHSLKPLLEKHHNKALILGTGGGEKAVAYTLKKIGIEFLSVTRNKKQETINEKLITYSELTEEIFNEYSLIVNATPVGMSPNVNVSPPIPYQYITSKHFLYDLIYNPEESLFLRKGKEQGAKTKNGLEMLQLQAEKSWKIWNGDVKQK